MLPGDTNPLLAAALLCFPGVIAGCVVYAAASAGGTVVRRTVSPGAKLVLCIAVALVFLLFARVRDGGVHPILLFVALGCVLAGGALATAEGRIRGR
ncbi:hypothetical protein [Corynebacterium senegalense]|uniref:hypothetical protein n=1 Tax=Corynebacterium senegalense TaxID=2080750 RepID=UPI0015F29DA4|nr:hypothetical protein [Corynebacterium senegalense]